MTPAAIKAAVRLAVEGVPVAAIARGLGEPSGEIWPVLQEARERGEIVVLPSPDWPPNSARQNRLQTATATRVEDLEALRVPLQRVFGLTPQQGRFLAALVCRREVGRKTMLHLIRTSGEINVVKSCASHLRARLAPHGFGFETVIDNGYAMTRATAEQILVVVKAFRAEEGLP